MHQQSAPTPEYGAPALSITSRGSRRGRCATCTEPIYDDQEATHVPTTGYRYPGELKTHPIPYRHTECPK